jgi:hypothetical protein
MANFIRESKFQTRYIQCALNKRGFAKDGSSAALPQAFQPFGPRVLTDNIHLLTARLLLRQKMFDVAQCYG